MGRVRRVSFAGICILVTIGLGLSGAERVSASGWAQLHTPNPSVRNGPLAAVACAGSNACEAVGTYDAVSGRVSGFAEGWNGSTWSAQRVSSPKGSYATVLTAASCASASSCVAVGGWVNGEPIEVALAERWNGSAWTVAGTPPPPALNNQLVGFELDSVSCISTTLCIAVGWAADGTGSEVTVADEWNGASWSLQTTPNPAGAFGSSLRGVACTSVSFCEAVGTSDGAPLAEQWNGSVWSIQPGPSGESVTVLASVSCSSSVACLAVGGTCPGPAEGCPSPVGPPPHPFAAVWNGSVWTASSPPLPSASDGFLDAVSCTAPTSCTAAGWDETRGPTATLAESWDGSTWVIQSTPNPGGSGGNSLAGVTCISGGSCVAVGTASRMTLVENWNGTAWSSASNGTPSGTLGAWFNGVWCGSATACIAVGTYNSGGNAQKSLAEGWNGTSWSLKQPKNPTGPIGVNLNGVGCFTISACIAVGSSVQITGTSAVLAEQWNGSAWSLMKIANPGGSYETLNAISCAAPGGCMAVGEFQDSCHPLAEAWNGSSWSVETMPVPSDVGCMSLSGVSCATLSSCVAVGDNVNTSGKMESIAEVWNGSGWSLMSTPNPGTNQTELDAVSCASNTTCMAVGNADFNSLTELWNGSSWIVESSPGPGALHGVSCPSTSACVAVGDVSTAEVWNGSSRAFSQPAGESNAAVSCTSATACISVGSASGLNGSGTYLAPEITLAGQFTG